MTSTLSHELRKCECILTGDFWEKFSNIRNKREETATEQGTRKRNRVKRNEDNVVKDKRIRCKAVRKVTFM